MTKIEILPLEQGTTRVFSLSIPTDAARVLRSSPAAQNALLGFKDLNPKGIEVFPVSDLGDLGLAGYLRDGVDAQESDIARDATKLGALDGWVMLVHSLAFGGQAVTLEPDMALTHIGTYTQTVADTEQVVLDAEAARPYTGVPDVTPSPDPKRMRGGPLVVLAIVSICALILGLLLT